MFFGLGVGAQTIDGENAASPPAFAGGVEWVEITQEARDQRIEEFKPGEFGAIQGIDRKKDTDYRRHVALVAEGLLDTDKAKLCAFYKGKMLYMYAIQYKADPRKAYYYSLFGKLYYFDDMSENYPNFPYSSRQYRANGKPVSYIHFYDSDTQYMYAPDGEFTGIWFKDKMYDREGKQILTRTNW